MAIRLKKNSFGAQLIVFYVLLFVLFGAGVFLFQQYREKTYRREAIENTLRSYARIIEKIGVDSVRFMPEHLRVTVINADGEVVYDNGSGDSIEFDNHLSRAEIRSAAIRGEGSAIRHSATKDADYFYYASKVGDDYVRVALPYDSQLRAQLESDSIFLGFFALLFIAALAVVYYFSKRFGRSVTQLNLFMQAVEAGKEVELDFPDNELGDIGRQIVRNYNALSESEHRLSQEHRKLVESIEISKKLKHEMTGNIAHELKTPVAAIRGYVETLLSQNVPHERARQFLERCNDQVVRLSDLINDISLITKIEEVPSYFAKEPVNLYDILSDVLYDLSDRIASSGDWVENEIPEETFIEGNKTLVYSIFRNLIENTLNYAGRGVLISVKVTDESAAYYSLAYADNGAGIPAEHFARIFERFYRVDYGRARNDGGSGLGLSIVRNAVMMHGGEISAGAGLDGGLEFRFTLAKKG